MKFQIVFLILATLFVVGAAQATVMQVPGTHPSLGSALQEAQAGDVIEILPGMHPVRELAVPAGVILRGLGDDASEVILDGGREARILVCEGYSALTVIQNLTFRNGFATGSSSSLASGGALFVRERSVLVQNCRFEDNIAAGHGGAVRSIQSNLRLVQCVFVGNEAAFGGGAVDISYGAEPSMERCEFHDNRAMWGGAVSGRGWLAPAIRDCLFVNNEVDGALGYGGAIYADYDAAVQLTGCTFFGNRGRFGGAIGCYPGGTVDLDACTLVANTGSDEGGGVYVEGGTSSVTRSIISSQTGGGIVATGGALTTAACSALYGNIGGDLVGPVTTEPGTVTTGLDPSYCADAISTAQFRLQPDSPVAGASCGTPGAWPAACGTGIVQLTGFDSWREGDRLRADWSAVGDLGHAWFRITWSDGFNEREILFARNGDAYSADEFLPAGTPPELTIRLYARDDAGDWRESGTVVVGNEDDGGTDNPPPALPLQLELRAWPNPFNALTNIGLDIPRDQRVRVVIYDLDGRAVRVLADTYFAAGSPDFAWDGRDSDGRNLASGTYLVRAQGESELSQAKLTLLK